MLDYVLVGNAANLKSIYGRSIRINKQMPSAQSIAQVDG